MGRATAHVFAAEGARVACTDLGGSAEAVAAEITAEGGEAIGFDLDVSDPDAITAGVARVAERFGALDILINNAGISAFKPIDDPDYEATWDRALSILLTAHQRLVRAALPHLLRSGEGPHRQHRLDGGPGRHAARQPLRRRQARRHRPDPRARGGARAHAG
jgi:3-oxoacyl-[acyl-carrier protein] reductase